jgi:hypothetical protein
VKGTALPQEGQNMVSDANVEGSAVGDFEVLSEAAVVSYIHGSLKSQFIS